MISTYTEFSRTTGILAYHKNRAVGWCAVSPRREFPTLDRSRVARPIDDAEVWSIPCFYVDKAYRRQGLTTGLITAALNYARDSGAKIVEAYPKDPPSRIATDDAFVGLAWTFSACGFVEVARRTPTRPVMRYVI